MSRDRLNDISAGSHDRASTSRNPRISTSANDHQQRRSNGAESPQQPRQSRTSVYEMSDRPSETSRASVVGIVFYKEIGEIQKLVEVVGKNIEAIERLHNRAIVGVGRDETARINRNLDALQKETNGMLSDARQRLQHLSNETKRVNGAEAKQRKAQQATVAKKLMKVAQYYQKVQESYKRKYRERMEREIRIARPDASREQIERAMDSREGPIFAQEMLSSRIGEQRRALEEVQGRHQELLRMEESIEQLAQLFQDMQLLIDNQQESIDVIDAHVENAEQYVESGGRELSQAIKYREASRKKAWIIFGIVTVLLIIIAIILYVQACSLFKVNCPAPSNGNTNK